MKKILLVDDDPFILDIYSIQLNREGFLVDTARDSENALEKIKNNYPDLIILDLNLDANFPGPRQGLEMLRQLRKDPKTMNLKVVVMSNYDQKDYPELAHLHDFGVLKSFLKVQNSPEDVTREIKEILNGS